MGCGASARDTTGIELDAIANAIMTGAGVSAYTVSNAGVSIVNGTYVRDGRHNGAPVFKKGQIWLIKWSETRWYFADKDKLELSDGDYYSCDDVDTYLPPCFGWEEDTDGKDPTPTLEAILEGPAAYEVSGAGFPQANGRYVRDGMYEGAPLYKKDNLWLFRSRVNWFTWCIGDKDRIEESQGDLYKTYSSDEYPPASGWHVETDGKEPAPKLQALDEAQNKVQLQWSSPPDPQTTAESNEQ
eukprot:TRINITY_DN919_c2_g1_i2.p1 TRINITY_DN919_c2_g1~~TRINITY_DN919_c2_g1_i2.p1  ORF type:complete len:242 (-),score=40.75 TRINITY_DN919_c2_g1_i2:487-1212(-)